MKRIIVAFVFVVFTPLALAGDWVNDWFAQQTTTAPGSYQGQQRGYYTAGGIDARYRLSNDYLVSFQPPSIKVGCGGIDLMAGSMSYLNPQYLVQKLENILQAAPAFAFDLAMQEYCKPCVATLQFLEAESNTLNQLQMNDCQAAQGLAHAIVPSSDVDQQLQGQASASSSIFQGTEDNWEKFQSDLRSSNTGTAPQPLNQSTAGCSSDFNKVFLNGSITENAANLVGLSGYAPLMRGMLGDVVVTYTNNAYQIRQLEACPGNDQKSGDDFLSGNVGVEDVAGNCTTGGLSSVVTQVDTSLNGIATQIQSGQALTPQQTQFVNQSPIPIFNILRDSTQAGTVSQTISTLEISLSIAYAHRILDDLFAVTGQVLAKAKVLQTITAGGPPSGNNPNSCDVAFLAPAYDKLGKMQQSSVHYRELVGQDYTKVVSELLSNLQVTQSYYQQRVKMLNEQHNPVSNK